MRSSGSEIGVWRSWHSHWAKYKASYPEVLEMGEGGVKGFHLSVHQLPDHRPLLFSQTFGAQGLRPFSLLPDQGPSLLHGCVRHDHCRDSQGRLSCLQERGRPQPAQAGAGEELLMGKARLVRSMVPLEKRLVRTKGCGVAGMLPTTSGFVTTLWNSGKCLASEPKGARFGDSWV